MRIIIYGLLILAAIYFIPAIFMAGVATAYDKRQSKKRSRELERIIRKSRE